MRQASVLTLVLVACLGMVVHRASASPMGLTRIELNGANVSGSVSFEGNPWRGYFSSPVGGRVTISPYITGDNDDKVVRLYIGLGYQPSSNTHDWQASATGTGFYEFWYPVTIDYIFPNTTYYVAVVDSIILSADFTFNAKFDPMPAPSIASLKVGDFPLPGRVDIGQYTYYTATPTQESNLNATLQMTSGSATIVANIGSYATLGNNQWSAECATGKSCSLEALYIRKGETLFISVWGTEGRNQGDDDHDLAIDRYYISVASVQ